MASLFPCPRPQRGGPLSTPAVWALHLSVSPGAVREQGSGFPVWSLAFLGDQISPEGVCLRSLSFAPCPGTVDNHFMLIRYSLYAYNLMMVSTFVREGGQPIPIQREKLRVSSSWAAVEQVLRDQKGGGGSLLAHYSVSSTDFPKSIGCPQSDDICGRPFFVIRKMQHPFPTPRKKRTNLNLKTKYKRTSLNKFSLLKAFLKIM